MLPTASSKVLLPHEIDEIEQIFLDVLRGLGVPRNSEAAEAIAIRIINCYQGGVRESGALKNMIGFYKTQALNENSDAVTLSKRLVSMEEIAGALNTRIIHDELEMLQRTFDRVCTWCGIPPYGKRANRLARDIIDEFGNGLSDEAALFENAMWREQNSDAATYPSDA